MFYDPAKTTIIEDLDNKPTIRILHNMARSGGTMVSKCLGAMSLVRLFSEIHPKANHAEYLNVTDQAHRWYGLTTADDVAAHYPFIDGLRRVHALCEKENSIAVLRDWASIDFIGLLLVDDPVYRFSLNEAVESEFDILECALVRHPLDQWLSTRRLNVYQGKLDQAQFFYGYRRYAEAVQGNFFRYEDFIADPSATMQWLCSQLEVPFDPTFIDRWHLNEHVTGDNKKSSRGSSGKEASMIRPLPRRQIEPELQTALSENGDYQRILTLLNYQT